MNYEEAINAQYGQSDLSKKVAAILNDKDLDIGRLSHVILAPIEELHLDGKAATLDLANEVGINEKMKVLDVGCGIGGPARTLASEFGCHITGIDLSKEYCKAAELINNKLGLNKTIEIQQVNALDMPFDNEEFDVVLMQHVLMNIENKQRLLSQINRVLLPKGRLAHYTICAGSGAPIHFPVIWASNPDISFLLSPSELRQLINNHGFKEISWKDYTTIILEGMQMERSKPEPTSIDLLFSISEDFLPKIRNVIRNLKEGRMVVIQGIFESES